ncbi:M20/M25/M40 family metallo-hydrolase [Kaistella sp. BT6-1-3]|uniref:M20/M25/M40 family metallo-hydrolase n=1 Tax=Kaistella yananensis TaxID=2989820 RepID=A0ABT3JNK8_9FLAO|nr:M20/M25/M40 family metallo-hydrolase [Kaistella yananensis]MCW4452355.1 M20/M25/M40 family metallo-hydrolase [Kaistella yananensis]
MNFSTRSFCIALLGASMLIFSQERNLRNIQKLTFGGDNAEAYFSPDGKKLTLQVTNPTIGAHCDQIYLLDLNQKNISTKDLNLISTGTGRTTCSFFMPDGKHVIYASTHEANKKCPAKPKPRTDGKYLWPIYEEFDIYEADLNGKITRKFTDSPGYDAEAVVSPDGKYIVFTSTRSGDLELWRMDIDGKNLKQLTFGLGYDGGAFFSHDSKKLVFRSSRPSTAAEIKEYKDLLAENLVAPTNMEIYTMNIDGSGLKQITNLGKANWSPYFHPSDKKILFSSNHHSTRGYDFQIYSIDLDGSNLTQITYESEFNAFPMFSHDGKKLVFSSNRQAGKAHETNVFIADWVETDHHENVSEQNLKKTVSYLASDELKGRLTGSEGEKKASEFISKEFKSLKLKPRNGKSYFQDFTYDLKLNPHEESSAVQINSRNVIGYLDNKASKTIIIGAHYDHLGLNEHHNSTLMNSNGQIHNGADDNASGVSAVLELARMFSQNKTKEKANYVFALFSGEEDGLMGSKKIAEEVKDHYPNVISMINLDMIGRLNKDKDLTVGGVGTSPVFGEMIKKYKPAGFNLAIDSAGVGPSDHTSFYLKDIPVLFLFTGTHSDYHKPTDDTERVNFTGLRNITHYVFNLANGLAEVENIPFTKTKISQSKAIPKYKVTLGIMPSYADSKDGLQIDGVTEKRPADLAGIRSGDVLIRIGKCDVKEVYSYMDCLSKVNSGDELPVTVLRDGKEMTVNVKF